MGIRSIVLVFGIILVTVAPAYAAPEFYVSVEGARQGVFKGELRQKGLEQKFAGLKFDYEIISQRDPVTGVASQRQQHKPIRIQKAWGPASLQFYAALLRNEALSVTIDFVTRDQSGAMVLDHTVRLTGAAVVSFASRSEVGPLPTADTIELVFRTIEIIDHKTKTAVADGKDG